jgi:hypothetical protein
MARYQYRYNGIAAWQGESGNAIIALLNKLGSGKKILVHSLEINNCTRMTTATLVSLSLHRTSETDGGEILPLAKLDSNASLPSGISLRRNISAGTSSARFIRAISPKQYGSAAPTLMCKAGQLGRINKKSKDSISFHNNFGSDTEPITLRPGETLSLIPNDTALGSMGSQLLLADITFVVSGSPKRTYMWSGPIWVVSQTTSPLALINNSASNLVYIKEFRVHETGTLDSPYFRFVPVGGISPTALSNPQAQLSVIKLDSNSPDLSSSIAQLVADAPLLPYGVPEVYLSDSSAGTPKGTNYLHTKDFIGPMWIGYFPEFTAYGNPGAASDKQLSGLSNKLSSIKGIRDPIVIREGEAVALVSSAELATGTSAVGTSGWSLFEIGLIFSVEPTQIPKIEATGLVVGSRWYIERVSDNVQIAQGVTSDGTMSYTYTADDTPLNLRFRARKSSSAPFYKTYEATFQLTNTGISIPVSQIPDS